MSNNCLKCGTCQSFKEGPAHPRWSNVCSALGVQEYAEAPDCYSPAPIKIVRADVNVSEVGKLLRNLDEDQMHVLGQLLTQATALNQVNLKFGQPVFVNMGADDYLTNYFKGYVIGMVDTEKKTGGVYISSDLTFEQGDAPSFRTLLRLMPSSLMTLSQFKVKRLQLIDANLLESPVDGRSSFRLPLHQWLQLEDKPLPKSTDVQAYEPPTIDTAPTAWLDAFTPADIDSLKLKYKKDRKVVVTLDEEAQRKRKERAAKNIKVTRTVVDGETVVTVQGNEKIALPSLPNLKRK